MIPELLLAALTLTIAGFLVLLDHKDRRLYAHLAETDRRAQERETAHREEIAQLLQRIQAPQVAVMEHNTAQHTQPGVTHPMTDHEHAQQEEWAKVVAEMERVENEALELP